jgi:hypothetical protein
MVFGIFVGLPGDHAAGIFDPSKLRALPYVNVTRLLSFQE